MNKRKWIYSNDSTEIEGFIKFNFYPNYDNSLSVRIFLNDEIKHYFKFKLNDEKLIRYIKLLAKRIPSHKLVEVKKEFKKIKSMCKVSYSFPMEINIEQELEQVYA